MTMKRTKAELEEEVQKLAAIAARYAVADPGKDARDDFFRRVASLGNS